jgi:hypothetical protein
MSARLLGLVDRLAAVFGAGVTGRSATAEFGPPPAVSYPELRRFTDSELLAVDRDELLATLRRERASRSAQAVA